MGYHQFRTSPAVSKISVKVLSLGLWWPACRRGLAPEKEIENHVRWCFHPFWGCYIQSILCVYIFMIFTEGLKLIRLRYKVVWFCSGYIIFPSNMLFTLCVINSCIFNKCYNNLIKDSPSSNKSWKEVCNYSSVHTRR